MFVKIYKKILLILACICIGVATPHGTDAASLSLSPSKAQAKVGQTINFQVRLNTQSAAINTVDGVIDFNPEVMEIVSVSRSGSILNIWIEEPNFSNATGKISFAGGVIAPGYTGSSGLIFSITAKAKKVGSANFDLQNVSIRQNDGEGTEVSTASTDSLVTVANTTTVDDTKTTNPAPKPAVKPVATTVAAVTAPSAPVKLSKPELVSNTHPKQNEWYSSRDAVVDWQKNTAAAGVQIVFDSNPNTVASGPVYYNTTQKTLKQVRDGISYLHVRYVGKSVVSETSHYAIQVDTLAPTDLQIEVEQNNTSDRLIKISAQDTNAGVAFANVSIDGSGPEKVSFEDQTAVYSIPTSYEGGVHSVHVEVYDSAGNASTSNKELEFKNISKVDIHASESEIRTGKIVYILGKTTKPDSDITLTVKLPSGKIETYSIKSDATGNISFPLKLDEEGNYHIRANTNLNDVSEEVKIYSYRNRFDKIGVWFVNYGWVYVLILAFISLILLIARFVHKRCVHRQSTITEQSKAEKDMQLSQINLREEAMKQVVYLEKISEIRPLTKEEKNLYTLCRKMIG